MSFKKVDRELKPWTFVTEVRFAVRKTPNGLAGSLTLPPAVAKELGWTADSRLDVEVGEDEDAGWFCLSPSPDATHRAKVKILDNGVLRYATKALVPSDTTSPKGTDNYTPATRIEGDKLFLQLTP